jgi:hypothetical protein
VNIPARSLVVFAALASVAAVPLAARSERTRPTAAVEISTRPAALSSGAAVASAFDPVAYDTQQQFDVEAYLAAVERQRQIDEYLAAVEAQRIADEQAARARSAPRAAPAQVSGDCAAVAAVVGAGTVQRESGGNPLAENGIYKGCAQIGMPWWNGACAGLDWTNPSDQAECAQIVMRLQGPSAWATTYGG